MTVIHSNGIPFGPVKAGDFTTIQTLLKGPNFVLRRFRMGPGGGMPEHTNTVEHEQYVLKGQANIGIGDESFEVSAGDAVFIPEGSVHWYMNTGDDDFEFLCIIPNKPDEIKVIEKEC
jgi:quercetin dioxygenase-like cupin family protein